MAGRASQSLSDNNRQDQSNNNQNINYAVNDSIVSEDDRGRNLNQSGYRPF